MKKILRTSPCVANLHHRAHTGVSFFEYKYTQYMTNEIQIFRNEKFGEVRITMNEREEPMFCLADVCKALEISNVGNVKQRLSEKGVRNMDTLTAGGVQSMTYINEANLYKCIFQSRKPEAEKFQDWVYEEVLPSIRKHGAYATPQTIDSIIADPANGIKLLQALQEEREAKQLAQSQVAERDRTIGRLQPLADFAKTAFTSDTLVSISQAAKILKLPFGRNTLFKKLRESGIFFSGKNEPKQKYINADYFRMTEGNPIETSKGLMIPVTVYCTQKGLAYINLKFGSNQNNIPQLAKIV